MFLEIAQEFGLNTKPFTSCEWGVVCAWDYGCPLFPSPWYPICKLSCPASLLFLCACSSVCLYPITRSFNLPSPFQQPTFLSHEKSRNFSYQACWTSSTSPLLHSSRYSYACLCRESCFAHVCVKLEGASRTVNFELWPCNVYIQYLCTWSVFKSTKNSPRGFIRMGTQPSQRFIYRRTRRNVQVRGSCRYCILLILWLLDMGFKLQLKGIHFTRRQMYNCIPTNSSGCRQLLFLGLVAIGA